MTTFHLSEDDRFAVSLAVCSLGIQNKDTISGALCDRIAGSISVYLSEVDQSTNLLDWAVQLRSLAQLLLADAPSIGLIRTRVARLHAPLIRQIEFRALRLADQIPACAPVGSNLLGWAKFAHATDLILLLRLCVVEGGAMVSGRKRPSGRPSSAHFEPIAGGRGRGVSIPKPKGGRPADDAEVQLISHLAVDWLISTGVQPERGRDGHSAFSGLVHDVFSWIGIENKAHHCLRQYWKLTKLKRPWRW